MVDYKKWDNLDSDDDDDADKARRSSAAANVGARQNRHDESLQIIASWLREACPEMEEDELAELLHFVSAQHPGIHEHNIMRHQGITAFLEAADARGRLPSLHALLALGLVAKERSESPDAKLAGCGTSVLLVTMHAINTLAASEREGGARQLFDTMLRTPEGEVARRYRALEYATDCVRNPPADPRNAPPQADASARSWRAVGRELLSALTWRALGRWLLQQLMMGVIAFALMYAFLPLPDPPPALEGGDAAPRVLQQQAAGGEEEEVAF